MTPPRPPAGRAERLKLADEQLRSVRQSLLAVRFLLEEYASEPDIAEARICLLAADDNACDAQRAVERASAK